MTESDRELFSALEVFDRTGHKKDADELVRVAFKGSTFSGANLPNALVVSLRRRVAVLEEEYNSLQKYCERLVETHGGDWYRELGLLWLIRELRREPSNRVALEIAATVNIRHLESPTTEQEEFAEECARTELSGPRIPPTQGEDQ